MKKKEKHLSFYSLLTALQDAKGCAFCEMDSNFLHRYFENLLQENVNDPAFRKKLSRAQGFCGRHAHLLLSFNDALGTSILYKDQVQLWCDYLRKINGFSLKSLHREIGRREEGTLPDCPACLAEEHNRRNKIDTFLEWIDDDEIKEEFEKGQGFCREHLLLILKQVKNDKICTYLIEKHLQKYSQLLSELEEFIRKNDYRFIKDGFGKEGNSWLRAVKMLIGDKDLF